MEVVKTALSTIIVILYFVYLFGPWKRPCDYNSYESWWRDRKNWMRS